MTLFSFVLLSQVFSFCPGTVFYDEPNGKIIDIEGRPSSNLSRVRYLYDRDPFRLQGWTEVILTDGRTLLSKETYWIKTHHLCGQFIGR